MSRSPRDDCDASGAAFLGATHARAHANASDSMGKVMDDLTAFAARNARGSVSTVKGGIFERIEAAKFNADAARQGASVHARVTADAGRPAAPEDIEILKGSRVQARAQLKNSDKADWLSDSQSQEKYRGMHKVVPKDQVDATRGAARRHADESPDHADTARRVRGELRYGEVRSGGTTHDETLWATRHPRSYGVIRKGQAMAVEGGAAASAGAANAALMAGLFGAVRHGVSVHAGKMSWQDAARATGSESLDAAKVGAVRAVGATVLRTAARESGATQFAQSAIGGVMIASTVEVGVVLWSYARGEITAQQFAECAAGTTVRNTVGALCAKGVAAVGGSGAIAVIAPMAGVMAAGYVFQSCVAILENAALSEAERVRIEAMCTEAMVALLLERRETERQVQRALGRLDDSFAQAMASLDAALLDDDSDATCQGLSDALAVFGHALRFPTFEDFNEFLDDPDAELVL